MNDAQLLRYSRHILLNEISIEGQQTLLNATALVVGCGGLGAAALPYLAAAGIGTLIIADHDCVDETNLQRQISYREQDIGSLKSQAMQQFLQQQNSGCRIETHGKLDAAALATLAPRCDVILDCSDNFATRQAINAAAVAVRKPLVSGAAVRFDGQLAVYRPDLAAAPCYACLFPPDTPSPDTACATFGVFAPLVGIIGTMQAAEALKIIIGLPGEHGVLKCYNALSGAWQSFKIQKNSGCLVCGEAA